MTRTATGASHVTSDNPLIYWLATIVSAALLAVAWLSGDFVGRERRGLMFTSWFLAALLLEWFAPSGGWWALALLLQTALAIWLLVLYRLPR